MAEFTREAAKIEEVYVRRQLPNGDSEYMRRPYNLVTYDNGEQYVEPINLGVPAPLTFGDWTSPATATTFAISDLDPLAGVTEIR